MTSEPQCEQKQSDQDEVVLKSDIPIFDIGGHHFVRIDENLGPVFHQDYPNLGKNGFREGEVVPNRYSLFPANPAAEKYVKSMSTICRA